MKDYSVMQDNIYLFPFEHIDKGSKIIIYGAGNVGQAFLGQINMTGYCDVIAVADRAYEKYPYLGHNMIPPESISSYSFDKVVIAVEGVTRLQVMYDMLISQGISKELIVSGSGRVFEQDAVLSIDRDSSDLKFAFDNKATLNIAFFLAGGLGDCIIDKKFILSLLKETKTNVSVDLYGDIYNEECLNSFFRECDSVKSIISGKNLYQSLHKQYDVAISVLSFAIIDFVNENAVKTKDIKFFNKLKELEGAIKGYELIGNRLGEAGIHFQRMKYRNENCFTFFSYQGVLDISDMRVELCLDKDKEREFKALDLPAKYITLNYGWGNNIHGEYKVPNKVWPFEYYDTLAKMIKEEFPDMCMVQTGMGYSPKIKGVDKYVFDSGLDTLEYVLMNSSLHFDCESGLVHLATQLGTKCVVVFGPTLPEVFGYPQNENILSSACNGCRALMDDFSRCMHVNEDRECMYSIEPEAVFEKIKEILISEGFKNA